MSEYKLNDKAKVDEAIVEANGEGREDYAHLLRAEQRARFIATCSTKLVPGLLQTREYTLAIANPQASHPHHGEVRGARQREAKRHEIRAQYVIGRAVLRSIANPEVMQGQVKRLLEASRDPLITVQMAPELTAIRPRNGIAAIEHAIVVLELEDPIEQVVYTEGGDTFDRYHTEPEVVDRYQRLFAAHAFAALDPDASRLYLERVAGE
jgi:hypothetical protein